MFAVKLLNPCPYEKSAAVYGTVLQPLSLAIAAGQYHPAACIRFFKRSVYRSSGTDVARKADILTSSLMRERASFSCSVFAEILPNAASI